MVAAINEKETSLLYQVIKTKEKGFLDNDIYFAVYDPDQEKVIYIGEGWSRIISDFNKMTKEYTTAKDWEYMVGNNSDEKYKEITEIFASYHIIADNNGIYWNRMDDETKECFNHCVES